MPVKVNVESAFLKDVIEGLSKPQKRLSSKYFYDDMGSRIFQFIMGCEEYYLTNCETEIFTEQTDAVIDSLFANVDGKLSLVELGAGDGSKTQILLERMLERNLDFEYVPIDISQKAIDILTQALTLQLPGLQINGICSEYFNGLSQLSLQGSQKAILFLGSTIGNFSLEAAKDFLKDLNATMLPGDKLFLGVDLKKDPKVIRAAYNDKEGHTRDFNMNLLKRINRELDGNFDLNAFVHEPTYNPLTGEARSYLMSKMDQEVVIQGQTIHFHPWEAIHLEISKKYDLVELKQMLRNCGYGQANAFVDKRGYFTDVLATK